MLFRPFARVSREANTHDGHPPAGGTRAAGTLRIRFRMMLNSFSFCSTKIRGKFARMDVDFQEN